MTESTGRKSLQASPQVTHTTLEQGFRECFAQWPSGVALITTMGPQGPVGMTASAVSSLSLDPLLAMVCIRHDSSTLKHIRKNQSFGVCMLRDRARNLAVACAGGLPSDRRFTGIPYSLRKGVPVLNDALAWMTCDLHRTHAGGDHQIVMGSVTDVGRSTGDPLVWHARGYRSLR